MNIFLRKHFEKVLLATGLMLFAASIAWASFARLNPGARFGQGARPPPSGLVGHAGAPRRDSGRARWDDPVAQSGGAGWVYEVFTPPVIYYNPLAKSFSVTPPVATTPSAPADESPFGVKLLAVKREPFRLQLVGYFGKPGDYVGAFVSAQTPETLLARPGRRFEQLGLVLKTLTVTKVPVEHDDPWPVYDITAIAVLVDERTGGEVTLDSSRRRLTDAVFAVVQLGDRSAVTRRLHEGDIVGDERAHFCVDQIQLDPPEVVIAKTTPGRLLPETVVLHLAATAGDLAGQRDEADGDAPPGATNGLVSADVSK